MTHQKTSLVFSLFCQKCFSVRQGTQHPSISKWTSSAPEQALLIFKMIPKSNTAEWNSAKEKDKKSPAGYNLY